MQGESHCWQYAWDVFNNWAGYFTGGLIMAVITFWYSWRSQTMKRKVLLIITTLFFVMGSYKAWEEQLERADNAERLQDDYLQQTHQYSAKIGIMQVNADQLQNVINSNQNVIGIQSAEINKVILQTDPGAKFVKQRAKILSDQMSTFITTEEYEKIEYFPTTQESADAMMTIIQSQTNQSPQLFGREFEAMQSKEEEQRIGMWIKVYEQFYVQFGYRISAIQGQIAELGYKTPKIDLLIANKADDYTAINHDLMGQFVHNVLNAASELQELAIDIKETHDP